MRKCVVILIIAVLFLFSGCNLIHLGGNNKPPASTGVTSAPKPSPSVKPTPSAKPSPSPEEETSAKPSHVNSGHIFGGGSTPSASAETASGTMDATAQDAHIQGNSSDNILSSKDDVIYTASTSLRADYNGDGKQDILKLNFSHDYPQSDDTNYPVKITMTIGKSSVIYEDLWNDGVSVCVTDFDTSDPELDIYVISLGTDLSATVTTYWYDGKTLEKFTSFDIEEDTAFSYDTNGYLYYKGEYEGEYGVMVALNFYTGKVSTVD